MIKILFICHGNVCRSPMAEFLMKDLVKQRNMSEQFCICSAATSAEEIGNPVHPGTRRILAQQGIRTDGKAAVQFCPADHAAYDYILAMDQRNLQNIRAIIGEDRDHKLSRLLDYSKTPRDIRDPWYTGNFEETFADISVGLDSFFLYLMEHEKL